MIRSTSAPPATAPPLATFTILGRPITKKNSLRIVRHPKTGNPIPIQSKAHEAWFRASKPQANLVHAQLRRTITEPVHVRALFYLERCIGDINNYQAALADLLERAGILANDRQIVSWDGTRLLKDAKRPRIDVEIAPA
jgi:Holliday junction resolvase RusA-like endonuclease